MAYGGRWGGPVRAKMVGGVKSGVCGVCEEVGPAVETLRLRRLGSGGLPLKALTDVGSLRGWTRGFTSALTALGSGPFQI